MRAPRLAPQEHGLLALLLLPWLFLTNRYGFVCDDAFITWRYSRNLAQGAGAVYNTDGSPPVEGYSDWLWMVLGAISERAGLPPAQSMPYVSAFTGMVLLIVLYRFTRLRLGVSPQAAAGATLFVATFPPFAVWSTSGLETMPFTLAFFGTWLLLVDRRGPRWGVWAGLAAIVLSLLRTEGVAWAAVIGALATARAVADGRWREGDDRRQILTYATIVAVAFGVFELWRFQTYHAWVANTALAKVHLNPITLLRGSMYIGLFATTLLSPLAWPWAMRRAFRSDHGNGVGAFAATMALGVVAYAVVVSGDYMAWFRILVPAVPFVGVTLAVAFDGLPEARVAVSAITLSVLSLLPAGEVHLVPEIVRSELGIREKLGFFRSENQQWQAMNEHVDAWSDKGRALKNHTRPGDTYVAAAIGALGYYSCPSVAHCLTIYDRNGLVNREVAEQPWSGELRSPGHDKVVDRSFFYDKKPTLLDSKVLTQFRLAAQVRLALLEMEAEAVRERYYPEIFEIRPHPVSGMNRYLLMLKRAQTKQESVTKWAEFEQWNATIKSGRKSEDEAEDVTLEE